MTALSAAIGTTDTSFSTSDDSVLGTTGYPVRLQIENEKIDVRSAQYVGDARTRWYVDRGVDGTAAATHDAGVAITTVSAGGGGGGVTVTDGTTTVAATTVTAPPGTVSGSAPNAVVKTPLLLGIYSFTAAGPNDGSLNHVTFTAISDPFSLMEPDGSAINLPTWTPAGGLLLSVNTTLTPSAVATQPDTQFIFSPGDWMSTVINVAALQPTGSSNIGRPAVGLVDVFTPGDTMTPSWQVGAGETGAIALNGYLIVVQLGAA